MLKKQILSCWEERVKHETFFFSLLCFKKGKTYASRLSSLIVCTFIWLLNPISCFFSSDLLPLSDCSATPKIVPVFSVFSSCLLREQQERPRALCACDPATVCCQETPGCYVVLQSSAPFVPACVSSVEYRMRAMQTLLCKKIPHQCWA